jgi:hypothetical protein
VHELVHTVQQARGSGGLIQAQADFERDFAGRREVPASETPVAPPRIVRVTNPNGGTVWAPYGVYRPSDVPATYQDRVLESPRETVRDMPLAEAPQGRFRDIRVIMVRVGNDYRFVGYDRSVAWPGRTVTEGFVESDARRRSPGSEELTTTQRSQLALLAEGSHEPTPADAQRVLR